MIYVERHLLDTKTMMPVSSVMKYFTSLKEFNEFYKIAKADPCTVLNILNYDPQKIPGQKTRYDAQLYAMSREVEI